VVALICQLPAQPLEGFVFPDSAGVMDEVAYGDGPVVFGHLREVGADIVIQRKFSFVFENENARSCKLLADRACAENSIRFDGNGMFEAGHAVTLLVNDLSVLNNSQGTSRRIRFVPF